MKKVAEQRTKAGNAATGDGLDSGLEPLPNRSV
jgi:hypothetical protein